MANLTTIPAELILQIADHLPSARDVRDLMLTARLFFSLLTPHILRRALTSQDPRTSPVIIAAEKGQLDCMCMFLRHDLDHDHDLKAKALFWACSRGQARMVQLLLSAGADPNFSNDDQRTTALHEAMYSDLAIARLVLDSGRADADARDGSGWTALHHAVAGHSAAMVRLLLDLGNPDIDARDGQGLTPLHVMSRGAFSSPEITRLLVERGVDVSVVDGYGMTAGQTLRQSIRAHGVKCPSRAQACSDILVGVRREKTKQ